MAAALVIGARNLGRAVIERLVADGWTWPARRARRRRWSACAAAGARRARGRRHRSGVGPRRAARRRRPPRPRRPRRQRGVALRRQPLRAVRRRRAGRGRRRRLRGLVRRAGARRVHVPQRLRAVPARPGRRGDRRPGHRRLARRAHARRGLWAAGAFGVRALTQAAALELREHRIHVALLIVDATDRPLRRRRAGARRPREPRRRGRLPGGPGPARDDPRAPGHAGARPVGAVAARSRCTASRNAQPARWSLTRPHACISA